MNLKETNLQDLDTCAEPAEWQEEEGTEVCELDAEALRAVAGGPLIENNT